MQKVLNPEDIRNVCDPAIFKAPNGTEDVENKVIIGQERAIKALKLGLGMRAQGFNIYVSGAPGTGKLSAVTSFVAQQAKNDPTPPDWCYVNNFKDSYRPEKLSLPPGKAVVFKKEMKRLVNDIYSALVKAFESEDYADKKQKIINTLEDAQAGIFGKITEHAEKESFSVKQTKNSIITIPLKDGKPLTDEDLHKMTEAEVDKINERQNEIQDEISAGLREVRKYEKESETQLEQITRELAQNAIGSLIDELSEQYKSIPAVVNYLQQLKADIMENLPEFMKTPKNGGNGMPDNHFHKRYEVTVLVDNENAKGAPVITERNPTYNNLLGRMEKESFMGTLITDFTMIRKGSLHSANGGYLIIRIEELLQNYFAWDCLKRALKNKEIEIEEAADQLGYLTTRTLKPEPIPLNIKVILIGTSYLYELLYEYDPDFRELFKVKADFDNMMVRTDDHVQDYSAFIRSISRKENLLPADNAAMAKMTEYGSRLVEHQNKLSTQFGVLFDIIREANYYALLDKEQSISAKHVTKAIEEKIYRSNLIQEKINEMITTRQIFIDITGAKVGQINGLSVLSLGDIAFGIPARITCTTSLGRGGIIAIEREAELSGPIHTKGVLILTGYLTGKFMQDKPLSLSARLVFEQSYSGVEGDSASSTELYAILSTLSNLPIKQGIAVTGSVNQKGEIQPIGGINEKIEGYFEICKAMGFNGEQGVLVPSSNIKNMMLKEEIVEAVKEGKFKIWAADTIDDGIEILTGVKSGSMWEEGTVFWLVNNALVLYAERMKEFSGGDDDEVIETAG